MPEKSLFIQFKLIVTFGTDSFYVHILVFGNLPDLLKVACIGDDAVAAP